MKEGATNMIEEIDKGMDQLKEQYIEPYVNQRKSSKGELITFELLLKNYSLQMNIFDLLKVRKNIKHSCE